MVKDTRPTGPSRVPLPVEQAFDRMHLEKAGAGRASAESLSDVEVRRTVLQDYTPFYHSLESRLSELAWSRSGVLSFAGNRVPYAINNSGNASRAAARLFYAHCLATEPEGDLEVLELGAGAGLFARYFLDSLQALCRSGGGDFYDRLLYHVTDSSPQSVAQWEEREQFAPHRDRVSLAVCDATNPGTLRRSDGATRKLDGVGAIFCNYLLDVLPSTVVRRGEQGIEELLVRTCLDADADVLARELGMEPDEIAGLGASDEPERLERLLPLLPLFDLETRFRTCEEDPPYAEEALELCSESDRVLLNHGALSCLEACLELLAPDGFLLVNDYGPTTASEVEQHCTFQRFGSTTAIGVNFPLIERFCQKRNATAIAPDGDERRPIHTRLICRDPPDGSRRALEEGFSGAAHAATGEPVEEARRHLAAGRKSEALDAYRQAVERSPRDWLVLGEAAEFVALHLLDFGAGLELAAEAVEINPWYSAWLWNVLGDCLFCLERFDDAHEAYLQAQRIDPDDARTNLNLAYSFAQFGRFPEALERVAHGLVNDEGGVFRDRLLQKQQGILAAMSGRWAALRERMAKRIERLGQPAEGAVKERGST